jgi:sulfatase maturation enzyme AslB (radical SAM superfamily)
MWTIETVKHLDLELTQQCNAACPMCARNLYGSQITTPEVTSQQLRLSDFRQILPAEFIQQLASIHFNGNYGDLLMAEDTIEICKFIKLTNPKLRITATTNGGGRGNEWWAELAKYVSTMTFNIDGLPDTHHLYRRNTKWEKIVEHAKAFMSGGGAAYWTMLVFKHNEHQVEACRTIAKALGFKGFNERRTSRFSKDYTTAVDRAPVLNKEGTEIEYYIELPSEQFRNEGLLKKTISAVSEGEMRAQIKTALARKDQQKAEKELPARMMEWMLQEQNQDATPISCGWAPRKLMLDSFGRLWPCCFMAMNPLDKTALAVQRTLQQMGPEGVDNVSLFHHSPKEVLEGAFYKNLTSGWNSSVAQGCNPTCRKVCGKDSAVLTQAHGSARLNSPVATPNASLPKA